MSVTISDILNQFGPGELLEVLKVDPLYFYDVSAPVDYLQRLAGVLIDEFGALDVLKAAIHKGNVFRAAEAALQIDSPPNEMRERLQSMWLSEASTFSEKKRHLAQMANDLVRSNVFDREASKILEFLEQANFPDHPPLSVTELRDAESVVVRLTEYSNETRAQLELIREDREEKLSNAFQLGAAAFERLRAAVTTSGSESKVARRLFLTLPEIILAMDHDLLKRIADESVSFDELNRDERMLRVSSGLGEVVTDVVEESTTDESLRAHTEINLSVYSRRVYDEVKPAAAPLRDAADLQAALQRAQFMEGGNQKVARFWLRLAKGSDIQELENFAFALGLYHEGMASLERDVFRVAHHQLRDSLEMLFRYAQPLDPEPAVQAAMALIASRTWTMCRDQTADFRDPITWFRNPESMFRDLQRVDQLGTLAGVWVDLRTDGAADLFYDLVTAHWGDLDQVMRVFCQTLIVPHRVSDEPRRMLRKLGKLVGKVSDLKLGSDLSDLADEIAGLVDEDASAILGNRIRRKVDAIAAQLDESQQGKSVTWMGGLAMNLRQMTDSLAAAPDSVEPRLTTQLLLKHVYPKQRSVDISIPILVRNAAGSAIARDVTIGVAIDDSSELKPRFDRPENYVGDLDGGESQEIRFPLSFPRELLSGENWMREWRIRITVQHDKNAVTETKKIKVRTTDRSDRKSPFHFGRAVKGAEFIGRESILRRLRHALVGTEQSQSVLLYGIRRVGKTSIIRHMSENGSVLKDHAPIWWDVQDRSTSDTSVLFLKDLCERIRDGISPFCRDKIPFSRGNFETDPYGATERFLQEVEDARPSKGVVLLLDEFDNLLHIAEEAEKRVENNAARLTPQNGFQRNVFGAIRKALMKHDYFNVVFVGMPSILRTQYQDRLFALAEPIHVGPFTDTEALELVGRTEDLFETDPRARRKILEATGRNPYLLQLMCHKLWVRMGASGRDLATRKDVDVVIEELLDSQTYFTGFDDLWKDDRPAMVALALALEAASPRRYASLDEIARYANKRGWKLSPDHIKTALQNYQPSEDALNERPLVTTSPNDSSRYRFIVGMLGDYLIVTA